MSIKDLTKPTKIYLVSSIETKTTFSLFPELLEDTKLVAGKNSMATLGFVQTIGLVYQGVKYHPEFIKPINDLGTYLPLHKSVSSEFSAYLTKHRDTLNAFSIVRNMLLKSVTVAGTAQDMAKLTTLPLENITDALVMCSIPVFTNATFALGESDVEQFHKIHKKAIDAIEYYSTFSQMFGDIEND